LAADKAWVLSQLLQGSAVVMGKEGTRNLVVQQASIAG